MQDIYQEQQFHSCHQKLHFLSGLAKLQQTNNELSPACDIDFFVFDDCNFPNFVGHICRNFSAQDINPGM